MTRSIKQETTPHNLPTASSTSLLLLASRPETTAPVTHSKKKIRQEQENHDLIQRKGEEIEIWKKTPFSSQLNGKVRRCQLRINWVASGFHFLFLFHFQRLLIVFFFFAQ